MNGPPAKTGTGMIGSFLVEGRSDGLDLHTNDLERPSLFLVNSHREYLDHEPLSKILSPAISFPIAGLSFILDLKVWP